MSNGWDESALAWIAAIDGDFARNHVLDRPMLERALASGGKRALDVGCGEGRFCRMLAEQGIACAGIDPTAALIERARAQHPEGEYLVAGAEALPFEDGTFDLVVSYLSLIDIADATAAVREMARVLAPGGRLLIANVNSLYSAANPSGWRPGPDGRREFILDRYMDERADWVGWKGIRIQNWHRPLSTYMQLLIGAGLVLKHFDEPMPHGGGPVDAEEFRRVPSLLLMEWQKA